MQISVDDQLTGARAAAAAWWAGRPFPQAPWGGPYRCDACGAVITTKDGTALTGGRLLCPGCADRLFATGGAPVGDRAARPQGYAPYGAAAPIGSPPSAWTGPPPGSTAVMPPRETRPLPPVPPVPPTSPPRAPTGPARHRRRRGLAIAAIAVATVVALLVGLFVWAPWADAPPSAPTGVAAASVTASSATIRWAPSAGEPQPDAYLVLRDGTEVATVGADQASYVDKTLVPGSEYRFSVVARAGDVRSDPSAETVVTTPTPSPGGLVPGAASVTSLTFRWTPPANSPVPDQYVILRDGQVIGTVGGNTTSYSDTGLVPSRSHSYQVAAVWGENQSAPTAALRMTTVSPTLAAARLQGSFSVAFRVTDSGGGTLQPGRTWSNRWTLTPKCSAGACSVTLIGVIGPAGYTPHTFTMVLNRDGATYSGATNAHITVCGRPPLTVPVNNGIAVRLTVRQGVASGTAWTADTWTGTVTIRSPYTRAGMYFCPAQTVTATISGS